MPFDLALAICNELHVTTRRELRRRRNVRYLDRLSCNPPSLGCYGCSPIAARLRSVYSNYLQLPGGFPEQLRYESLDPV